MRSSRALFNHLRRVRHLLDPGTLAARPHLGGKERALVQFPASAAHPARARRSSTIGEVSIRRAPEAKNASSTSFERRALGQRTRGLRKVREVPPNPMVGKLLRALDYLAHDQLIAAHSARLEAQGAPHHVDSPRKQLTSVSSLPPPALRG